MSQYCLESRFWPKQLCASLSSCGCFTYYSSVRRLLACGRDQVFEEVEQVVAANQKIMRVRTSWRDAVSLPWGDLRLCDGAACAELQVSWESFCCGEYTGLREPL